MKLILRRKQNEKKGMFGGNKGVQFLLYAKAELTSDESELVKRYQAEDHIVAEYTGLSGTTEFEETITVGALMNGYETDAVYKVTEMLTLEDKIKDSCTTFKKLLDVCKSFGGEEVIEY